MWKNMYGVKRVIYVESNNTNDFTVRLSDYATAKEIAETEREIYAIPLNIDLTSTTLGYTMNVNKFNVGSYNEYYNVNISEFAMNRKMNSIREINNKEKGSKTLYLTIPIGTYRLHYNSMFYSPYGKSGYATVYLDDKVVFSENVSNYVIGRCNLNNKDVDALKQHTLKVVYNNVIYREKICTQNGIDSISLKSKIGLFIFLKNK